MPYEPTTNFRDSNGADLGKRLVTKDYLLEVYEPILSSLGNSELTVTPALWTWGKASAGQLGVNDTNRRTTPVTTFAGGTNWKFVACTSDVNGATVAIKTDGTLWVWGENSYGDLGINDNVERSTPVTTFAGGTNWKFVAGGLNSTVAIKTDGTLWGWGRNVFGQLGINVGGIQRKSTPVTTFAGGNNWKSVSTREQSTAAIKTDGTLWTWGLNVGGELGINAGGSSRSTPVTTFAGGNNWKSVSCGSGHMAAIKTDGTLWTWGRISEGQLGNNDTTGTAYRSTPITTFAGGTNWKSVSCGDYHTAAIKTDGTLWVWGSNNFGELGINNTITRSTPVTTFVGGTNWKSVAGGVDYTTAIKTDGTLWTWGRNNTGQLGINDTTNRSTPVTTFAGGNNWKSVACGGYHTAAIRSDEYI